MRHCAFCVSVRLCVHLHFLLFSLFVLFIYLFPLCGSPPTLPVFHVLISWELYTSVMPGDKLSGTELYINLNTVNIFARPCPAVHCNNEDRACLEALSLFLAWQDTCTDRVPRSKSTQLRASSPADAGKHTYTHVQSHYGLTKGRRTFSSEV